MRGGTLNGRPCTTLAAAVAVAAGLFAMPSAFAVVATFNSAINVYTGENESLEDPTHVIPGHNRNHPGFGFAQTDGEWDDGISSEFEFSGSDGAYLMNARAAMNGGYTGAAGDHGGYMDFDYNPAPPDRSFGNFWFGGIGADCGPTPGTSASLGNILFFVDVLAPAGQPYTVRAESDWGPSSGNGFQFLSTGAGTWQTIGGSFAAAQSFGNFNFADPVIGVFAAFGPNEIVTVDDGTVPGHKGVLQIDNVTLTIAAATWNLSGAGNWSAGGNWQQGFAPDGANTVATFGTAATTPTTVTVDGERFAGTLVFDNAANSYTLAGSGTASLVLRVVGAGTNAGINVVSGSHAISAPLTLWSDTTVNIASAASTLTVSNLRPSPLPVALSKSGPGTMVVNQVKATGLTVTAGAVRVASGATANSAAGVSRVNTLSVAAGATLDLNNNSLVVNNGTLSSITSLLKSGLENSGNFDWLGPGIGSTQANVQNTTAGSFLFGLGVILNDLSQVGGSGPIYTTFAGETLAGNEVLVKFTYFGDADLSGSIDATDYSLIDNGYVNSLSGWINGDFDYSGSIDATDYALIDNAYVNQTGPLAEALIAEHARMFGGEYLAALRAVQSGVIPEPAAMGSLACMAWSLRRPRRRASARS